MNEIDLAEKDSLLMRDFKDDVEPSNYIDGGVDSVLSLDFTKQLMNHRYIFADSMIQHLDVQNSFIDSE